MTVVSDTGPLIALALVDQLHLLAQLYESIAIPPAVHRELLAKHGPEAGRLDQALIDFVNIRQLGPISTRVQQATTQLHQGEQQAIALAHELTALLVIDDRAGRRAARGLGLAMTGTVGVLVQAKKNGLLSVVRPVLEEMRQQGYWLSDELLEIAIRLAGED